MVEAREGGQVAVEAIQHRADHGVVVDDVAVLGGGAGEDVDAKDRGPAGEEDRPVCESRAKALHRIGHRVGQAVWQEGPEQEGGAHERARHQ